MKKLKFDLRGMKFNIWFYFAMYAFVIIGILWLFQIVFLTPFYTSMKQKEVVKLGNSLTEKLRGGDEREYLAAMRSAILGNNVNIILIEEGTFQQSWPFIEGVMPPHALDAVTLSRFIYQVNGAPGNSVYYSDTDLSGEKDERRLIYGAKCNSVYLYISATLAPVQTTATVLRTQLFIITLILMLLGIVMAWITASRLSKPLAAISGQAKKMGGGDYDVTFPESGYTEIDELAGTLNYAAGELKKTDELRKELMANVSHDLRTPLTMVKAYAEMIRDISGDNRVKREQHAKVIIEEADRLSHLVDDILNLSRLERGTIAMDRVEIDLSGIVNKVVEHLSVLEEREGYRFTSRVQPGVFILGDASRMEQVVYNLISNAVNYTGEDKSVSVSLYAKGSVCRFEVTDTGAGIAPDEQRAIWNRYYRSGETHKRPVVGTGLGLSIVKNLLTAHRAAFGVESAVGKGSTFWFETATLILEKNNTERGD